MENKRFTLVASVSTNNPEAIRIVLERIVGKNSVTQSGDNEFRIETEMERLTAKVFNRSLFSELRRSEGRTRLRAEWTSGEITEHFFDYVLKKITKT